MQASSLLTCLWPGLPRLWWRGDWQALLAAVSFAVVVNFALMASFVWPEMLSSRLLGWGWCGLLVGWAAAVWMGVRQAILLRSPAADASEQDLFVQAQTEYLRGHWLEAESLLRQRLAHSERDLEASLLLATLLRRTGRGEVAGDGLDALARMDGAEKWALEIQRERRAMANSAVGERESETAATVVGQ